MNSKFLAFLGLLGAGAYFLKKQQVVTPQPVYLTPTSTPTMPVSLAVPISIPQDSTITAISSDLPPTPSISPIKSNTISPTSILQTSPTPVQIYQTPLPMISLLPSSYTSNEVKFGSQSKIR